MTITMGVACCKHRQKPPPPPLPPPPPPPPPPLEVAVAASLLSLRSAEASTLRSPGSAVIRPISVSGTSSRLRSLVDPLHGRQKHELVVVPARAACSARAPPQRRQAVEVRRGRQGICRSISRADAAGGEDVADDRRQGHRTGRGPPLASPRRARPAAMRGVGRSRRWRSLRRQARAIQQAQRQRGIARACR